MGRILKRVPLDFDYPLNQVWYGYFLKPSTCISGDDDEYCNNCITFAQIKGIPIAAHGCPNFEDITKSFIQQLEPPEGDGYQLWDTTSKGKPISPVFETLDDLCEWCEDHATTFSRSKATKEQWHQMLEDGFVFAQQGNAIFI